MSYRETVVRIYNDAISIMVPSVYGIIVANQISSTECVAVKTKDKETDKKPSTESPKQSENTK